MPIRKIKGRDELTTEMHSEFEVDDDIDQKHATWTALLDVISSGAMDEAEAMEDYGVSNADLDKYKSEWLKNL